MGRAEGNQNRLSMARYPALIDGKKGAYGVTFPDLPGIVAMGKTIDEAMRNAEEALLDYAIETEKDNWNGRLNF